jgi:hypothetical protein
VSFHRAQQRGEQELSKGKDKGIFTRREAREYTRDTCHERARKKLPFIKLTDSIFDVLPQQAPFVGRHMTIATTLIQIGGNCSAQHRV